MIRFHIDDWRAWAPGLATPEEWARWGRAPWHPNETDGEPDVSFLPPMQRRRLSRLARMVFHAAWPLAEGRSPMPMIFVSRHGEISRTFAILSDLAQAQPLSPTQFSLSVHNATIGLWSILRGDPSEMTALACEGDGLELGALEAAALLDEGAKAVLLVVAEEFPTDVYRDWVDDVPCAHAVALRLCPGDTWALTRTKAAEQHDTAWPHALRLVNMLSTQADRCQNHWKGHSWTWQHGA